MNDCCPIALDVAQRQRGVLHVVLGINVAMFLAEVIAGLVAHSTALLADSVDMLGDAVVYGCSLYVVGRGRVWEARAALLKGTIMAGFGLAVLAEAALKIVRDLVPAAGVMGGVGVLALTANTSVLLLLWHRRGDDVNMRSAWLCSRNDVVANAGVLLAAGGVVLSDAAWPDIAVGLAIAAIFVTSSVGVIREALRAARPATA